MKGGFISIYKPAGVSSFKALSSVKRFFDTRKVGHLGTLDPLAEGVLPVAVDEGTKLIPYTLTVPKTYEVEIYFGQSSATLDRERLDLDNLETVSESFSESDLTEALQNFLGEIEQLPPKFSALKVDGRRAYDMARSGEDFELKKRVVEVFDIKVLNFCWPIVSLNVSCGSGFYVRSLVRDIGEVFNVDCFMYSLIRKSVGPFNLLNSSHIDKDYKLIDESQILENFVRIDFDKCDFDRIQSGLPVKSDVTGLVYGYFDDQLFSVLEGAEGLVKVKKNLKL